MFFFLFFFSISTQFLSTPAIKEQAEVSSIMSRSDRRKHLPV